MPYSQLLSGRWSETGRIYHLTCRTRNSLQLFKPFSNGLCVSRTLWSLQAENLVKLHCWMLMPDHFHGLMEVQEGMSLAQGVKLIKGRSARNLNRQLGRRGAVWQKAFYDRALRKEDDLQGVARYIVANPVRAGIVSSVGAYPFWRAVWL
ncbi:MAG: REP-associated tyrosine transposase [Granulosicoccaceae bacterium]